MESRFIPTDPLCAPFACHLFDTEKDEFPVPMHWHCFGELILVKSGTLKVVRDTVPHLLRAGEILFINPMTPHSLEKGEANAPTIYNVIRLDMAQLGELPSYTPDLRSMMLEADHHQISMHLTAAEVRSNHMDFMIDQCVEEFKNRAYGYDLKIRAMLYLIVTTLIRIWIRKGFTPQVQSTQIDPIYTIPSYINRHIEEPLKVEEMAKLCGLSYPWFAKKFHQLFRISCKDHIEKVRIRKVEQYLLFTDCDLNYISQHCGYSDCSHLVRNFRKFHDTTPIQFRHNRKQKNLGLVQIPQNY